MRTKAKWPKTKRLSVIAARPKGCHLGSVSTALMPCVSNIVQSSMDAERIPVPKGWSPHVSGAVTSARPPLIPIACHNMSAAPGARDGHLVRFRKKGTGHARRNARIASRYGVRISLPRYGLHVA